MFAASQRQGNLERVGPDTFCGTNPEALASPEVEPICDMGVSINAGSRKWIVYKGKSY